MFDAGTRPAGPAQGGPCRPCPSCLPPCSSARCGYGCCPAPSPHTPMSGKMWLQVHPETPNPKPEVSALRARPSRVRKDVATGTPRNPQPETRNPDPRDSEPDVKLFREGLVFKAHRLLYHSTLGLRAIKKRKKIRNAHAGDASGAVLHQTLLLLLYSRYRS